MDRKHLIYNHLLKLGVPVHLKGYKYMAEAIDMVLNCPEVTNRFTTVVYPTVGLRMGSTGSRVERAIRHAIEVVFSNTDVDVLYEYFGNTINQKKGKVANSHFIMAVAERIRLEENDD